MRKRLQGWIKEREDFLKKHKKKLIALAVLLAMILIFTGTKTFLLINFLLGNDVVVRLETQTDHLYAVQGEVLTIESKASVITNPFCEASCTQTLIDISENRSLAKESFILSTADPYTRSYDVLAPKTGHGEHLIRISMQCTSTSNILCHTQGKPIKRDVLITLSYNFTQEDSARQEKILRTIPQLNSDINEITRTLTRAQKIREEMVYVTVDTNLTAYSRTLEEIHRETNAFTRLWDEEKYEELEEKIATIREHADILAEQVNEASALITYTMNEYNSLLTQLKDIHAQLTQLNNIPNTQEINDTVESFDAVLNTFTQKTNLGAKKNIVTGVVAQAQTTLENTREEVRTGTLENIAHFHLTLRTLCALDACPAESYPSITTHADTLPTLKTSCELLESLPMNTTKNATHALSDFQNPLRKELIQSLTNETHAQSLKVLLAPSPEYNATATNETLLASLSTPTCTLFNPKRPKTITLEKITPGQVNISPTNVTLTPPFEQCCVFGECQQCCTDCTTPIVFIHGHAFNKGTSAEYSLHAFNSIQDRLEEDGYLSAGTVSLYTAREDRGRLAKLPVPVTLKASYYLDVFEEPENTIIVQTKSENIDTYAIRLKEILDTITYQTGSNEVILIAHSMGGLVSRRYIQLFGESKVERLIMIGTPNKGVVGDTAEYCSVIGEKLECRDMNEGSLFMNKLNREPLPNIPVFTIVGRGCEMDGEDGDGVILADHVALEGATNLYLNGTCQGLTTLHTEMLEVEKYPQVYEYITRALS